MKDDDDDDDESDDNDGGGGDDDDSGIYCIEHLWHASCITCQSMTLPFGIVPMKDWRQQVEAENQPTNYDPRSGRGRNVLSQLGANTGKSMMLSHNNGPYYPLEPEAHTERRGRWQLTLQVDAISIGDLWELIGRALLHQDYQP